MIKVLAIDDEEPIRQWLKYCISKFEGYSCITAASAREGIELFWAENPDIILTDIEMQGMNGLEMLSQLRKDAPDLCSIILTSHDDFEYARTALTLSTTEYILKTEMTEQNLLETLKTTADTLKKKRQSAPAALMRREHFLQSVALGKMTEPLSLELLEQYQIPLSGGPMLAVDCWNRSGEQVIENISAAFPLKSKVLFTLDGEHIFCLLDIQEGIGRAKRNADTWEDFLALQDGLCCGISDIQESAAQLSEAIDQARKRCSLHYYIPGRHVAWKDSIPPETMRGEHKFQMEYMRALLDQNFYAACDCLEKFARAVYEDKPSDINAVKKLFYMSANTFLQFTDGAEGENEKGKSLKRKCMESESFEQLLNTVKNVFQAFMKSKGEGVTLPIRRAVQYMEEHSSEKITLSEVAEYVSFSAEHFSRRFTKEMGVNFVTYLNNLRMKNAVKLLETTNYKVYEIAEKVGFFSLSYFSTSFKKKFGQNPCEYQLNSQKRIT